MTLAAEQTTSPALSLSEELILMLLNEENGYFHQVPGWDLNCAIAGAALGELSLLSRIDTDMEALFLLDPTPVGNPALDAILKRIADDPGRHSAQYWVERFAPHAEDIVDQTLDHLVTLGILEHHDGDFWTLSRAAWQGQEKSDALQFVRTRISNEIFSKEIPDPRDALIISLINTCDVFRFIYQLDEEAEERIQFICQMDLIARSIAAAVSQNMAGPLLRRPAFAREIPTVSLRRALFNPNLRSGNMPALFADLAREYGPVFQIKPPFQDPMIFLAGSRTNRWAHRSGRMYLRAKDYFSEFEKMYGANGVLPALDGADHFRLRKSLNAAYSRMRLEGQLDQLYQYARTHMAGWQSGDIFEAVPECRRMINAQISPLFLSVDSQDLINDVMKFKERAIAVHIIKALPRFTLNTPSMKRKIRAIDDLMERVQSIHTPAQRADVPRDLVDDVLSLHASDPQFFPESNLRFALSAALVASVYLGDMFCFCLYAMASRPELQEKIQAEADALFANGDPSREDFTPAAMDVTHRFLMECMRMYPIVPMSIRTVMNSCMLEGFMLPVGTRVIIAQTATHYMDDVFPEPHKFDIDRYQAPRNEHHGSEFAPFGLGPHTCLGHRWMELQLAVNVLMVAHYFALKVSPANYKLKINWMPSLKPNKKLKFLLAEKRREIPA